MLFRSPGSPGAKHCANLITEIEAKSANIFTESVWNSNPAISVQYRNVEKVFFRAYSADWESFLDKKRPRPEQISDQERRAMLAKAATHEWSSPLPATADFKQRTISTPAPATLKPGFYFIFASHDPGFGDVENQVSMATVWVSELALVLRQHAGLAEGFVLEAGSGEPLAGAEVQAWYCDQNGNRIAEPLMSTDTNGFFSVKPQQYRDYLFRVRHQGRELASTDGFYAYGRQGGLNDKGRQQTVFFTDRAIYRPGQTIQYKGICLDINQSSDNYQTLAGEQVEVLFRDPNGKEIARAKHRANDYGSFSGSFTAPRDRLMGAMSIVAQGRARGSAHFRVEEYKRPKFEVTMDAPKVAPKLGDKSIVAGKATSYTGAAVDGAKVSWRVMREVSWPWWCGWWRGGFPSSPAQEIAHGTAKTGVDGAFTVEFIAKPDLSNSPTNEPTFVYSITADVTDTAGETRSADRSVRVGYAALEATLTANNWLEANKPIEVKVTTTTLDGEPQLAEGSVKVHRLKSPAQVVRARINTEDLDEDGKPDADLSNPINWELADVAEERGFTTDTNGVAKLPFKLPAGVYRVMLETQDRFGKKVTGRLPLQVIDPAASSLAIKIPHLIAAPSWETQPGEEFMLVWGTGYEAGRAFIEIESRNKFIERYWTSPGRTQQQIKLAVTEIGRAHV